jgi:uncharacterized membrane protein
MGTIFKRGLIALAPVAICIAIIVWLLGSLEEIFRVPIVWLIGEQYYFPGMGLIVAIIFIFIVGIIINNFLIQKFTGWIDALFIRIPLVKTLYNSITDVMNFFRADDKNKRGQMVLAQLGDLKFLAVLTREDFSGLPKEFTEDDEVNVYVPMSYQVGGFSLLVPRSSIKKIDLSVEEGMRYIVTAGMLTKKLNGKEPSVKKKD